MIDWWTEDLSVGLTKIDNQHKLWFAKAEELFLAGRNRKAKEYVGEMLDFMEYYTKKHFYDEERFMVQIGYPGYKNQKELHSKFVYQLEEIQKDFKESGGNVLIVLRANKMVVEWLRYHISHEDKKIGDFVRSQFDQ